tara:strand:- start:95 stop:316 length:222 start_codon:yes stop_codon:yes gene_type:complete
MLLSGNRGNKRGKMNKVYEYCRNLEKLGLLEEYFKPEDDYASHCCSAPFNYPGWTGESEDDICSVCGKPADIQ